MFQFKVHVYGLCVPVSSARADGLWQSYDNRMLQNLVPFRMRHHVTPAAVCQLKRSLDSSMNVLVRRKLKQGLDNVAKALFSDQQHWDPCMQGILFLFVKLLTIPCSEALMESYGSIMEHYHKRFTAHDAYPWTINRRKCSYF